ncbi:MAG: tryptophan-rich sensory protein [Nanoarchaeota archaeon]|nr:tryptophan-rich sensory protein [Nanoarchaeota archaeon]
MFKNKYVKLIASIVITQLAGILGSFFTITSISSWYSALNKPWFNPPNWIFGPVWTALYLMMGISLFLVWNKGVRTKIQKRAVFIFGVQLGLNSLWSILFFGIRSPLFAFIEIIFLWIAIVMTIGYFIRISKAAAYLLIPYILWVSFAAALNLSILMLN